MISRPLVSVVIPTYNSSTTLAWAISSVFTQTVKDIECLVVNDGSTDGTEALLSKIEDCRLKTFSFESNCGRAVARQYALDHARGKYIGMVDADDWLYPWKLERQVQFLDQNPEVSIVSSGMAIIDADNKLIGVRGLPQRGRANIIEEPLARVQSPPIAHGPSLIRVEAARRGFYKSWMKRAQDSDFLLQLLLKQRWAIRDEITYAYSEPVSISPSRVIKSHLMQILSMSSYLRCYPVSSFMQMFRSTLKITGYSLLTATGAFATIVSKRWMPVPEHASAEFEQARKRVGETVAKLFDNAC